MERVMFTVAVMRCHQCQRLMHPAEPFFQRQLLTAVEVSALTGKSWRYERVNICAQCEQFFIAQEKDEHNRKVWFWIWTAAVIISLFVPYAVLGMYPAIIGRLVWKWWAKRRQKSVLGQADQRRVPRTAASSDAATELTKGESS